MGEVNKDENMGKVGVGALFLLSSGVICKAHGALFRLPLTNMLGFEGIGVFQIVMSLFSLALVVSSGGVSATLSKLISTARARKENVKVKSYLIRAFVVCVGIGLVLGLVFLSAGKGISHFQKIEENKSYLLFVLLVPLGSALAVLRGYFQGYENMLPTAISQVVEQVTMFAFGLLFAYVFARSGVAAGVFGSFVGVTISEAIALCVLFVWYFFKREKQPFENDIFSRREFDRTNFTLTLSASILPFVNAFDGLVIVPQLMRAGFSNNMATKLFGLQSGAVGAILNLPLIISIAVATALLPNLSFIISKGRDPKRSIEKSLKALLFFVLPTTFGLVAISKQVFPLFYTSFQAEFLSVVFSLMLYGGFSIVFTAIMQLLLVISQAYGKLKYNLIALVVGGVVKANLSFFLASLPGVNIFALVFGNLALSGLVCVVLLAKLKQLTNFSLSFKDLVMLIFGTLAMFFTVYNFLQCDYFGATANLVVAILLGIVVYGVFTIGFVLKFFQK